MSHRFGDTVKAQRRSIKKFAILAKKDERYKHYLNEAKVVLAALDLIRDLSYEQTVIKRAETINEEAEFIRSKESQ